MRAARNKTKIRLIQNIKREITSRIKQKTLNHSHILTYTHSHKHANVDLHTNTLTLVEVNTSSKPHIGCKKKKTENSHTYIYLHTYKYTNSARFKNEERKSQSVRQFHQFCLFFVYQNLGNLLPKFFFWKTKKKQMKREGNSRPWRRKTQNWTDEKYCYKCNLTTVHRKL